LTAPALRFRSGWSPSSAAHRRRWASTKWEIPGQARNSPACSGVCRALRPGKRFFRSAKARFYCRHYPENGLKSSESAFEGDWATVRCFTNNVCPGCLPPGAARSPGSAPCRCSRRPISSPMPNPAPIAPKTACCCAQISTNCSTLATIRSRLSIGSRSARESGKNLRMERPTTAFRVGSLRSDPCSSRSSRIRAICSGTMRIATVANWFWSGVVAGNKPSFTTAARLFHIKQLV